MGNSCCQYNSENRGEEKELQMKDHKIENTNNIQKLPNKDVTDQEKFIDKFDPFNDVQNQNKEGEHKYNIDQHKQSQQNSSSISDEDILNLIEKQDSQLNPNNKQGSQQTVTKLQSKLSNVTNQPQDSTKDPSQTESFLNMEKMLHSVNNNNNEVGPDYPKSIKSQQDQQRNRQQRPSILKNKFHIPKPLDEQQIEENKQKTLQDKNKEIQEFLSNTELQSDENNKTHSSRGNNTFLRTNSMNSKKVQWNQQQYRTKKKKQKSAMFLNSAEPIIMDPNKVEVDHSDI